MNQPDGNDDPVEGWLEADEAAALLEVKRETLYAYVSRGRIRSRASGGRRRSYQKADVLRLKAQTDARAGHGAVAAGALRWGEPVLDSAITRIDATGPAYRGHVAVGLAERGVSFERVAELLLAGTLVDEASWSGRLPLAPTRRLAGLVSADARPVDAAMLALPAFAMRDPGRHDLGVEAELRVARRIIRGLAASLGALDSGARVREAADQPSVSRTVAVALGVRPTRRALLAIDRALVVCADHELNASSFACRIAAAAGADLYACTLAGLATLTGARHGGVSDRVAALCDEVGAPELATRVVRERLRRGDSVPGFGHPLYPDGDPRARSLLDAAVSLAPRNPRVRVLVALVDTLELVGGDRPTLDVGLVSLAAALGLPPGGATALFAVGRSAGWLAHAMEQRAAGYLLRPRARYVGPPLSPDG